MGDRWVGAEKEAAEKAEVFGRKLKFGDDLGGRHL